MLPVKLPHQGCFWRFTVCHVLPFKLRRIQGIAVIPLLPSKVIFLLPGIKDECADFLVDLNLRILSVCKCVTDFHFCRSPFRSPAGGTNGRSKQREKEPGKQHKKCRLPGSMSSPPSFGRYRGGLTAF